MSWHRSSERYRAYLEGGPMDGWVYELPFAPLNQSGCLLVRLDHGVWRAEALTALADRPGEDSSDERALARSNSNSVWSLVLVRDSRTWQPVHVERIGLDSLGEYMLVPGLVNVAPVQADAVYRWIGKPSCPETHVDGHCRLCGPVA